MSADFLEIDKALEALLEELHSLKSTAQQLQAAERNASQVLQSAEKVTGLSAQVIQDTTKQVDAVSKLAVDTEKRMQELIAEQKAFADATEHFLRSDLQPRVENLQRVANTVKELIAEQNALAEATEHFLRSDLQPKVENLQRVANAVKWLVVFTLLFTLANVALAVWLNRGALLP